LWFILFVRLGFVLFILRLGFWLIFCLGFWLILGTRGGCGADALLPVWLAGLGEGFRGRGVDGLVRVVHGPCDNIPDYEVYAFNRLFLGVAGGLAVGLALVARVELKGTEHGEGALAHFGGGTEVNVALAELAGDLV
jgi:hypothetical protein